jgi:ribosome maturation factor RimP
MPTPFLVSEGEVGQMSESAIVTRLRALVTPIAADLGLDVYDLEFAGGVVRITLDTPAESGTGVDLDQLALATRLISRELDHTDPVPGRYTLEVTSPGLERHLRTPEHFRRAVGSTVNVRLHRAIDGERRLGGELIRADDETVTIRVAGSGLEHTLQHDEIERARTVFVWGPTPKPGKGASGRTARRHPADDETSPAGGATTTEATAS